MAKIVKLVRPQHNCRPELDAEFAALVAAREIGVGTIVECSCGQQFRLQESQRDGLGWALRPGQL